MYICDLIMSSLSVSVPISLGVEREEGGPTGTPKLNNLR